MNIEQLSLDEICRNCAQATADYFRKLEQDTRYCYELFRRMFILQAEGAVECVWKIYTPLIQRWVLSHPQFAICGETVEYLSAVAFEQFYFALMGSKFESFPSLPHVMQYIKMCVHTTVAQLARKPSPTLPEPPDEDIPDSSDLFADVKSEELWKRVEVILTTERDRHLAWCVFILDMKPAEIAELFRDLWDNEQDSEPHDERRNEQRVRTALYRIRKKLRSDPDIQNWLRTDD